ncbi:MAG: hypothetical protein JSR82_01375 [Verrucomicrobia bacterium]|nr:hypothetical protein [Verrucomicrobiota bacterium]
MALAFSAQGSFGDAPQYRLRLNLRSEVEPVPWAEPFSSPRALTLGEFVPPVRPLNVRLDWVEPEPWDWAGLRRQLLSGIRGARKMRFQEFRLTVEAARPLPARSPVGPIVDASTAARVRARLAGDEVLRGTGATAICREGRVQLTGQFARVAQTARALTLALSVEGVREAAIGLPDDLAREVRAGR